MAALGVGASCAAANPQAAAAWVESLPAGKMRDGAAAGYARQVAASDPAASLSWAATVTVEALRDEVMSGTIGQWLHKDRAAPEAWLAQNPDLPKVVRAVVEQVKSALR